MFGAKGLVTGVTGVTNISKTAGVWSLLESAGVYGSSTSTFSRCVFEATGDGLIPGLVDGQRLSSVKPPAALFSVISV